MKILHASLTDEFAGSEMYCASLAGAQVSDGAQVRVIVRDTPYVGRWREMVGAAHVVTIPKWIPSVFERWVAGRMMRGFGPDVVHTHLGKADEKVGGAAKTFGFPWVTTVHLRWKPEAMSRADAAICIAGWQRSEVVAAGYKGLLRVIWNWLPKQKVASSEAVEQLRMDWGATAKTLVFGSVGRLHSKKGMDILIKAFMAAYPDSETDVRLVIVGQGPERLKLEGLKGPEKRIIFTGYQKDLAPYYEAFDAYVSAARYEPFGLTILEAMAHGCQLICTRTEGPSEFLQEASGKGQVLWAERGHVESLAAVLRVAQVQGRGHITYDLQPFTMEKAVREIHEVYEEVVSRKSAG